MIDRITLSAFSQALTSPATEAPYRFSPTADYSPGGASGTGRPNTLANTQHILASPPSHATGRPWGDNRSADEIAKSDPELLSFTSNRISKNYLKPLYQKVGDFSTDNHNTKDRADAMYNLSQVISYITSGTHSKSSGPGKPLTDGHSPGRHHPVKNTNYELFNNFRLNGYSVLEDPALASNNNAKDDTTKYNTDSEKTQAPPATTPVTSHTDTERTELNTDVAPTGPTGRPVGDKRSAEQVLKENLEIVNSRPSSISDEALTKFVGDFTPNNPDPNSRADAAYNLVRLLHYTDSVTTEHARIALMEGSEPRYKYRNNGKIDGEFQSPLPPPFDETSIFPGSEAAILYRAVTEGSYSVLPADKSEYSKETKNAYPGGNDLKQHENNYKVTI